MASKHLTWTQYVRVLNADLKRKEAYVADIEKMLRETEDPGRKQLFGQLLEYRRGQAELAEAMIRKAMKSWSAKKQSLRKGPSA